MNILWVEDEFHKNVHALGTIKKLASNGSKALVMAESIDEALDALSKSTFEVILLDSHFPGDRKGKTVNSGVDLYERLRLGEFGGWGVTCSIYFYTNHLEDVAAKRNIATDENCEVFSKVSGHQHQKSFKDLLEIIRRRIRDA